MIIPLLKILFESAPPRPCNNTSIMYLLACLLVGLRIDDDDEDECDGVENSLVYRCCSGSLQQYSFSSFFDAALFDFNFAAVLRLCYQ